MKEFIEKLIERLEEYKYSHLIERDSEMLEHCKEKEMDCEGSDCFLCVWDKATEIVNQLAEEYNNESVKGDLISRSALIEEIWKRSEDATSEWETAGILNLIHTQTAYNDEWTLCNNGLPRSGVSVIVSYKDRFLAQADGTCEGWYDATNMIWHLTDYEYSDNVEVIAWRERLAPYQQKGE